MEVWDEEGEMGRNENREHRERERERMEVWDEEGEMGRNENRETQGKKRVTHHLLAPSSSLTVIR